jgi:aminodeoxychorismate synthase component I
MKNLSPFKLIFRKIANSLSSEKIFESLYSQSEHPFWLDSSRVMQGYSRFSFMGECGAGECDFQFSYQTQTEEISKHHKGEVEKIHAPLFPYLDKIMRENKVEDSELPFKFCGGLVGYLGYELKRETSNTSVYQSPQPDAAFFFITRFLAFDHLTDELYLVALINEEDKESGELWLRQTEAKIGQIGEEKTAELYTAKTPAQPIQFCLEREYHQYLRDIAICKQKILDGESYEVCLTNQVKADLDIDDWHLYKTLRSVNPAPYAAFFRFGAFSVLSSSPEQFLDIQADRWVSSKPIKGTVKRGETEAEDLRRKNSLGKNEKDQSENLMIVDLLRNDLGKVCEIGSVSVPVLMAVETYATVHQLVSTVKGRLKPEFTAVDCVKAVFPGGSITGAPKLRTMEIIDQLEWEARGVYTGSIGFFSGNGTAEFNIAIRTIVHQKERISLGVGGAIIDLSDPEAEFREILVKAYPMIQAIIQAVNPQANHTDFLLDDKTGAEILAWMNQ